MNLFKSAREKVLTYKEYIDWVADLVAKQSTSGPNQDEVLIKFTQLNLKRMQRLNKTITLNDELVQKVRQLEKSHEWWVITEAWCGDSAQNLPFIGKLAEESEGKISLKIVSRDYNLELIDKYLTNGGRSIPKLVAFDGEQELYTYGPRPKGVQVLADSYKKNPNGKTWDEYEREVHTWYAKDKGQSIQEEMLKLFK